MTAARPAAGRVGAFERSINARENTLTSQTFIGLISGTSMDGIDAALVRLDTAAPPVLLASHSHPLPAGLRERLLALAHGEDDRLEPLARLDVAVGREFAAAALALLETAGQPPEDIAAIGSHGQTVRHLPEGEHPTTVQIGDPNILAERTGITTVADFRRRDMAAGGQGAPLVPAFHAAVLRDPNVERTVVNIGGIANVTILPANPARPVLGFDTGPGNVLMDTWAGRHLGHSFDAGGQWAASGTVIAELLAAWRADPYFGREPPKSTGREHFNPDWLAGSRPALDRFDPADVQASLCELTASTIAEAVNSHAAATRELLVCGGGAHNTELMARLARALPDCRVESTAGFGLDPDWVEAMAFAWLARQTLAGRPGNLPDVTGARHAVVLGGIYPGKSGK